MKTVRIRAYFYLLIVTMIWGFAVPIIKFTLQEFDPGVFLVYRFAISAALAVIYFAITGEHKNKLIKKHIPKIFSYAVLTTTISLGALFVGLERTTVLDANILTSTAPLLLVIAGAIFLREKIPNWEKLGATIAFTGTAIAVILPILSGTESEMQLTGNLLILAHIVSDITAILLVKSLLNKNVPSGFLANITFIVGFITIAPFVLFGSSLTNIIQEIISIPIQYHLGVWYMAILSGTVAYALRNNAQKHVEVGKAGLFGYLNPVFATPLAVLWLGEKITLHFVIGAILITIGVIIAEMSGKTRKKIHFHIPHLQHHK